METTSSGDGAADAGAAIHPTTREFESRPLKIFLSYGHDERAQDALALKQDLEERGHQVWFDLERLRAGAEWERYIEEGLAWCDKVLLLMTPHSVRRRNRQSPDSRDGFCLNEIAKAIERNKRIVPVLLAWVEEGPPVSICRIQHLDLTDCVPIERDAPRYRSKLDRLFRALEQDDLDFEGGQTRLQRLLKPMNFDPDIRHHLRRFTGRDWISRQIDEWVRNEPESRLFWLAGGPGLGKSAFATRLRDARDDVVAAHFCIHGHQDKGDPSRAILSIAYQLAQRFPEYGRCLQELALEDEVIRNSQTLFDNLLVEPLSRGGIEAPDRPMLVVLDALDEATRDGRNDLAEFVASTWHRLPSWLRLFVTSRPEPEVLERMRGLRPHLLLAGDEALNLQDLRAFVDAEIAEWGRPVSGRFRDALVARSEGMFLYAVRVLEELRRGDLSPDDPDALPLGITGFYRDAFRRRFPDPGRYDREVRPLLECVCAQREPLPLGLLGRAVGMPVGSVRRLLRDCGTLFPVRPEGADPAHWTVTPFHKSLPDWLSGSDPVTGDFLAGEFALDADVGAQRLARACLEEWREAGSDTCDYALKHGVAHLQAARLHREAADLLTDFDLLMTRCRAGMVEAMLREMQVALRGPSSSGGCDMTLWEAFLRERAHLLARGTADWPADRILLQLALEHADDSPVTQTAEVWLASGKCSWTVVRNLRRPAKVPRSACLRVLEGHKGAVVGAAVLHDGRFLSWSTDGTLRFWSTEGQSLGSPSEGHSYLVVGATVLPDGRILSWSMFYDLQIWSSEGKPLGSPLEGHSCSVVGATALPDGRILSWSVDGTLRLWSSDGKPLGSPMEGHSCSVVGATALPDGRILSWSEDGTLRLWSAQGQPLGSPLDGHSGRPVTGVALLQDGRILSWSRDGSLRFWSTEGQPQGAPLVGHGGSVLGATILPDSRILSWFWNGTLRLWSSEGQSLGSPLVGHSACAGHIRSVLGAKVLPDGRFLSWSADGTLRLWSSDGQSLGSPLEGHSKAVLGATVLPDGRFLSWSADGTLRLWSSDGQSLGSPLEGHSEAVLGAMVLPDGRILSWSGDGILRLWSSECQFMGLPIEGTFDGVTGATALSDGRILSWSLDGTLRFWSSKGQPMGTPLEGHSKPVLGATVLPDGRILSWSLDGTLRFWSSKGQPMGTPLEGHSRAVTGVTILSDERILSWSKDGCLRLWTSDGQPIGSPLEGHSSPVTEVTVLPDGRILSLDRERHLRLWSSDGRLLDAPLEGHLSDVWGVCILPSGLILSWSLDETLRFWSSDGQPLGTLLEGHARPHSHATGLPDGRICSWSSDGMIWLWSSGGQPQCSPLKGHSKSITGATSLPGGRIVSWSEDATVRWWSREGLLERTWHGQAPICQVLPRPDGTVVVVLERGPLAILSEIPPGMAPAAR